MDMIDKRKIKKKKKKDYRKGEVEGKSDIDKRSKGRD